jgi:hypothetical protein
MFDLIGRAIRYCMARIAGLARVRVPANPAIPQGFEIEWTPGKIQAVRDAHFGAQTGTRRTDWLAEPPRPATLESSG